MLDSASKNQSQHETMSGAAILIETLINHGVDEVFGFPGGAVLNIYDELYKHSSKIKHYITCHEQGAAHAADGYARATGRPGVVIATSGPGATNLVTGIATAYLDSSPVIAITGNVALPLIGKDSFQEVDIAGITMPITKHNYIVKDINELEDIICEAFQIAQSGRPGPVLIDIPKDIQIQKTAFKGGAPLPFFSHPAIQQTSLAEAAKLINESKKPYIYAGGGIISSGAADELMAFAKKIDAPIGSSMMGLSAVPYTSEHRLGMTGMHGTYASTRLNAESDLIIGIGVRFSDRATGDKSKYQENTKILHIDIDHSEIDKNIKSYTSVIGDIKEILPCLTELVDQRSFKKWKEVAAEYKKIGKECSRGLNEDGLHPKNIIKTVREYAKDDTAVATDVGQHQMWTAQYYNFSQPRTFLTSGGLGTMGFGMGAAIGAAVSTKQRSILFTGDGSFHMNMNELATAVMHHIPVVVIIMDNRVLGMVRQWQKLFYEEHYSNTTMERATDYVKVAEGFGAAGSKVESLHELEAALEKAFASDGPYVIDCIIDEDERVLPMIPPNGSIDNIITN